MCFVCNVGFVSKSNFGGSGPNKLTNKNNVGVILELFPQVIVEPWGQTNCQMPFAPGISSTGEMATAHNWWTIDTRDPGTPHMFTSSCQLQGVGHWQLDNCIAHLHIWDMHIAIFDRVDYHQLL